MKSHSDWIGGIDDFPKAQSRPPVRGMFFQGLALAGWLALCFAASAAVVFVSIDGWYEGIQKPAWNPPSWLFGPVWSVLYGMMGVAALLVWRKGGWRAQGRVLGIFLVLLALDALWTPIFFGMHWIGLAFAEIVLLWLAIATTLIAFTRVRKDAGALFVPVLVVGELRGDARLHTLAVKLEVGFHPIGERRVAQ